jgi:hypothetical protein
MCYSCSILFMWIYDSLTAVFIHPCPFSMFLVCSHFAPILLRHCYCTLLLYADVIILCCCLVMCLTIILCDGIMILCSLSCWLSVSFFILVLYSSILSHRLRSIVWTLLSSHLRYIIYQLYSTIGTYISYLTLTFFPIGSGFNPLFTKVDLILYHLNQIDSIINHYIS